MSIKNERVNSNIQRELSYILANEVKNPNIKFITITACDVTSDLSYAKVYFTTLNDVKETLKALKNAKKYMQKKISVLAGLAETSTQLKPCSVNKWIKKITYRFLRLVNK